PPRAIVPTRMWFLTISRAAAVAMATPSAMASAFRPTTTSCEKNTCTLRRPHRPEWIRTRGGCMPRLSLTGNTTVITGAASGMGAELARQLSAAGAHVALIDHDAEALASVANDLPGTVTTHVVDLRDDDAVEVTAAEVTSAHPRIKALITCAGSSMLGSLEQLTMEEMRWLVDVNLWGTVSITKALLPAMRTMPAAHITHLASVYALAAPAGRIPYAMSKF